MIDISDEEESTKKCFKYQQKLTGNLNIIYNAPNSMLCLWNKHQIFIHEKLNFEDAAKVIIPEFIVKETLLINNYLISLDHNGNIHLISLKFKHSAAKRLKNSFHPQDQNILTLKHINNDVISLKYEDNQFFICSYKIGADFQQIRKEQLKLKETYDKPTKCLLYLYALSSDEFIMVKEVFNNKSSWKHHYLLVISIDRYTVYSCLFSPQTTEETHVIKLYSCPTEISDVKILYRTHPEVIVGLSTGSLIRLALNTEKVCNIIHMNTGIYKFLEINDSIIYTDGLTMWKADNILGNVTFRQFFIKQIKDFVKCSDQIICTTYSNFVYMFSIDDESCYINPVSSEEYCTAETLLNNSDYLRRIVEEVKKMENLVKKINEERNYITTLALSSKQDVMDSVLQYKITVFDNYEDILNEDRVLTFIDEPKDIFDKETYFFLVSITTSHLQQNFKEILNNLFGDLRIHITLTTNESIIKTNTLKIEEELKKIDIVVTLKKKHLDIMKKFFVYIQLITRIPGVFDTKQNLWTCLHEKLIELPAEHFINTSKPSKNIFLKPNMRDLSEMILETAIKQFDTLLRITRNPTETVSKNWTFYVKLPNNYKDIFQNNDFYKNFHKRKRQYLKEQTSEEFLKSQSTIQFLIGNERTEVEIVNDGFSNPTLKLSGSNPKIALDIRNLFSNLLYNDFSGLEQNIFVNWSLYTTIENQQREIKECAANEKPSQDFLNLQNTFQRNIIANFPI